MQSTGGQGAAIRGDKPRQQAALPGFPGGALARRRADAARSWRAAILRLGIKIVKETLLDHETAPGWKTQHTPLLEVCLEKKPLTPHKLSLSQERRVGKECRSRWS